MTLIRTTPWQSVLCRELLFGENYRMPWRDDAELAQFRDEMAGALGGSG
ncbi:MAG TPA: hypothetical protein VKI44_10055 [Acetobacteraceae bacterium]|nr:hypothetical protein [Acetobacteraceae bacterium]